MAFTDHLTGERFTVPVFNSPYFSFKFAWSRQSDRVLVTAAKVDKNGKKDAYYAVGFVIIDVAKRSSVFVPTTDAEEVKEAGSAVDPNEFLPLYQWTPDGQAVAARYLTAVWNRGLRLRDLSGRPIRLLHWVGNPGRLFFTSGCERNFATCIWQADSAERVATVPGRREAGALIGWYDDRHLIEGFAAKGDVYRVVVVDFAGKEVRIRASASTFVDVRYTRG
jgi:hypothetical protein